MSLAVAVISSTGSESPQLPRGYDRKWSNQRQYLYRDTNLLDLTKYHFLLTIKY